MSKRTKSSNSPARLRIRPEVAVKLGFYVYAYVDPRNGSIFYIGKGCRGRALMHLDDINECEKTRRIAELSLLGLGPRIDIIAHGMKNAEMAFRIEAALIDSLGLGTQLTNRVRGFRALQFGRTSLHDLHALYTARPITVSEPVILIRINKLYRFDMTAEALFEATRGIWKCGAQRENARYGFAVYHGVVREVYEIQAWHPAGTNPYRTRQLVPEKIKGRWEFNGKIAEEVSRKYKNGSVDHYFKQGAQSPIRYINCKK